MLTTCSRCLGELFGSFKPPSITPLITTAWFTAVFIVTGASAVVVTMRSSTAVSTRWSSFVGGWPGGSEGAPWMLRTVINVVTAVSGSLAAASSKRLFTMAVTLRGRKLKTYATAKGTAQKEIHISLSKVCRHTSSLYTLLTIFMMQSSS